jgi:protein-S-isoprenylcysteine O-methyltransferase Ste14
MTEETTPQIQFKTLIRFAFTVIFMLAIMFLAAGTFRWWEAWAYVVTTLSFIFISRLHLIAKNPALAAERASADQQENVQPWDRILMPLTAVYLPLLSLVMAGLDKRFGLTPQLPIGIKIPSLLLLFAGSGIGHWAMLSNTFFSSQVRVQTDRHHQVVKAGPYRYVRHPGYAGSILSWVMSPIFFSSWLVLLTSIASIIASGIRTYKEDLFLQENLPGYQDYTKEVRWRWIPGIW